jgi:spermidine synthase
MLEQGEVRVEQQDGYRYLLLNGQRQSQLKLADPTAVSYPHLLLILLLLEQMPWRHLLQFGLGAGELNRALSRRWPDRQLSTVEQSADIIGLYQQYFFAGEKEQLICAPALAFARQLCQATLPYDMIFVDIYPWPTDGVVLLEQLLQLNTPLLINLPQADVPDFVPLLCRQYQYQLSVLPVPGYLNKILQIVPAEFISG